MGCSITDYVTGVLDESFDDPMGMKQTMPRSQGMVKKVSYDDGKTWTDVQELRNIVLA
ncbi:MAG: hypothetical protein HQ505_02140 [Nitrosopumilus sp.]|nr:hypothetical protein [Nitrosopumilus sp.]